jgi:hypothetical protein
MSVLWFDGLLTRLEDAGVYFLPEDDLDELLEAAAINRFPLLRVNLAGCRDQADLRLRLAFDPDRQADVPGLVLLLEHSDELRREAPAEFTAAIEGLQAASRDWAASGRPLWTFIALANDEFDALP